MASPGWAISIGAIAAGDHVLDLVIPAEERGAGRRNVDHHDTIVHAQREGTAEQSSCSAVPAGRAASDQADQWSAAGSGNVTTFHWSGRASVLRAGVGDSATALSCGSSVPVTSKLVNS